jgi:hypothetical protein
MLLYADEDFPRGAVEILRQLGHDVLTVHEERRDGRPDEEVLERARSLGRAVLTHNRDDFQQLHRTGQEHFGIVSASQGMADDVLANRVHAEISGVELGRWHLRVYRPWH